MQLIVTKTYDNPNCASGYKGKTPINPYHGTEYVCKIGGIIIATLSFADNKLKNFDLKTDKKTSEGLSIYFDLIGKSYDEIIVILNTWLNE